MRLHRLIISFLAAIIVFIISLPAVSDTQSVNARMVKAYGKMPLSFVENKGQLDKRARYIISGPRASAFFRNDGVTFDLWDASRNDRHSKRSISQTSKPVKVSKPEIRKHAVLKLTFKGADPKCQVKGINVLPGKVNYMIGKDKSKWHTGISTFKGVIYKNIWSGIDVIYRGDRRQLKYDIKVNPGADIKSVRLQYDGAQKIWLDKKGDLHIRTVVTEFIEKVPGIYQEKTGKKINISGGYKLLSKNTVGFAVKKFDPALPLVIDPASDLVYSTFLGGMRYEIESCIAVDSSGCAYLTGGTGSSDFPTTPGAYNTVFGNTNIFIVKLNVSGGELEYSTFLGGEEDSESAHGIAVDSLGCAYVAGMTVSSDFPTTLGAFDRSHNNPKYHGQDGFVTKLNPQGNNLEYSTFLGGEGNESISGIALDPSGCAYVVGYSQSLDFPTTSEAFDTSYNDNGDGFITKLNTTGSGLIYSSFFGGIAQDGVCDIVVDSTGCAYVVGYTYSLDFPTTLDAYDTSFDSNDAFIAKFDSSGNDLLYSTALGGSYGDIGFSIALDSYGCVYVTGSTNSLDFPTTPGAFDKSSNCDLNAFVTKLNPSGTDLDYSTYLGSTGYDEGLDIAVDSLGCAYVIGYTASLDFPTTPGAIDKSYAGNGDAFITKFNPSGSELQYSTFLGDVYWEYGYGITIDSSGFVYVTGQTGSSDFHTTPGAFDRSFNGDSDIFAAKLQISPAPINVNLTPNTGIIAMNLKTSLTSTYWDPGGFANIKTCYLMLNTGKNVEGAGYFLYDAIKNKLYLRKINEAVMIGGFAPGSNQVIDNGNIILYCAGTSIHKSGNTLIVNWSISLKSYFAETTCKGWMQVVNKNGLSDPMEQMGEFYVTANPAPVNENLTPNSGVITPNYKTTLLSHYSDLKGNANIRSCYLTLNVGSATEGTGYFFYDAVKNKLFLRKHDEAVLIGGFAPGTTHVIDNGYISLDCADTTIQRDGNNLVINWSVMLKPCFAGSLCIASMQVTNLTGQFDPMEKMGEFYVAAYQVPAGATERANISTTGIQGNEGIVSLCISANGRYVAFTSSSSTLVPNDTNGCRDVFVHDRSTGTTELVSVSSSGVQGNSDSGAKDYYARDLAISGDGRYVAFYSTASNLVSGDTNGMRDVFIRDRVLGKTELVSLLPGGSNGSYSGSGVSISDDGRYVAFNATDERVLSTVFVRDRLKGITELVSISSTGIHGDSSSFDASMSADGRYVAFSSYASNLVPGDYNGVRDIFVRDRITGKTEIMSVSSNGDQGYDGSSYPSISAEGRYVAFVSSSANLVAGDNNEAYHIFVRDRVLGTTECISVSSSEVQADDNNAFPSISADGRYVAFVSHARNLVSDDTNDTWDTFVRDRVAGTTERVSISSTWGEGNNNSGYSTSISADGRYVAFGSESSNLVSGDTNGVIDVFVRDRMFPSPINAYLTPNSGSIIANQKTMLTSIYADPAGYGNIKSCYLMLNTGTTTSGAGYLFYDSVKNKLYLRKTNEAVMLGGFAPGSANVIDNGSIILYCADTTTQRLNNNLVINWSIALKPYFIGNPCKASMQVTNKTGYSDPWEQMGLFSVN